MSLRRQMLALCLSVAAIAPMLAQDMPHRGRKYKAPPETSHIEVIVTKGSNQKPIMNAAVVFHPVKDGKDEGNLEVKTDPDGKATIDVIPTGSSVRVQVIASGYATFAEDYVISEPTRQILVTMIRPQEQVSTYKDNAGKASERKPGVQEPSRPPAAKPATPPAAKPVAPPAATAAPPPSDAPAKTDAPPAL